MAETTSTTNFEAEAFTGLGTPRERVALPGALFDGTVNMPVMHRAVKAYLANQRQGNASTKNRKWVVGGNRKPWRQKGTGRARQGSIRAPHWVGGGRVFGPTPRSYAEYVPRQMRALARKSAFNARAREGAIYVIDAFQFDAPKTGRLQGVLDRLGVGDRKVLILTDGVKEAVYLSGRNLPTVHVMPYADVSTYHILWSDVVLIESAALGQPLEPIAESEPTERVRRAKRPKSRARSSVRPAKPARPRRSGAHRRARRRARRRRRRRRAAAPAVARRRREAAARAPRRGRRAPPRRAPRARARRRARRARRRGSDRCHRFIRPSSGRS
jgi:large subunit ribosomal protein L4